MVSLHEGAAHCRVFMKVGKADRALTQTVRHRAVSEEVGV